MDFKNYEIIAQKLVRIDEEIRKQIKSELQP